MINRISKQYNQFAQKFSSLHNNLDKLTNKNYYPYFYNLSTRDRILDLGCGDGKDLLYFHQKGAKTYGIDSSERIIELAKSKARHAEIKIGFFEKIPFKNDNFSYVVSKYSMQTSKNIDNVYKEVFRVLKNKGVFVFLVVHPIRQFMEKNKNKKDYFKKEIVKSKIFSGRLIVNEPSHTLIEYFSPYFFKHFNLIDFNEKFDPTNAEMINGDKYPAFMIIKAIKKRL